MASESSCTIRLCHVAVVSYEPARERSANTSSTAPVHARVTVRWSAPQQAKAHSVPGLTVWRARAGISAVASC